MMHWQIFVIFLSFSVKNDTIDRFLVSGMFAVRSGLEIFSSIGTHRPTLLIGMNFLLVWTLCLLVRLLIVQVLFVWREFLCQPFSSKAKNMFDIVRRFVNIVWNEFSIKSLSTYASKSMKKLCLFSVCLYRWQFGGYSLGVRVWRMTTSFTFLLKTFFGWTFPFQMEKRRQIVCFVIGTTDDSFSGKRTNELRQGNHPISFARQINRLTTNQQDICEAWRWCWSFVYCLIASDNNGFHRATFAFIRTSLERNTSLDSWRERSASLLFHFLLWHSSSLLESTLDWWTVEIFAEERTHRSLYTTEYFWSFCRLIELCLSFAINQIQWLCPVTPTNFPSKTTRELLRHLPTVFEWLFSKATSPNLPSIRFIFVGEQVEFQRRFAWEVDWIRAKAPIGRRWSWAHWLSARKSFEHHSNCSKMFDLLWKGSWIFRRRYSGHATQMLFVSIGLCLKQATSSSLNISPQEILL